MACGRVAVVLAAAALGVAAVVGAGCSAQSAAPPTMERGLRADLAFWDALDQPGPATTHAVLRATLMVMGEPDAPGFSEAVAAALGVGLIDAPPDAGAEAPADLEWAAGVLERALAIHGLSGSVDRGLLQTGTAGDRASRRGLLAAAGEVDDAISGRARLGTPRAATPKSPSPTDPPPPPSSAALAAASSGAMGEAEAARPPTPQPAGAGGDGAATDETRGGARAIRAVDPGDGTPYGEPGQRFAPGRPVRR